MWETSVSQHTCASKEQIWRLWTDVANWQKWDKDIEWSTLAGDVKVGAKGILKPVGGPQTKFAITTCDYLSVFVNRSNLPLCKMEVIHIISDTATGINVTHTVTMTGFLSFLFAKIMGKNIKQGLPKAVNQLIQLAEGS